MELKELESNVEQALARFQSTADAFQAELRQTLEQRLTEIQTKGTVDPETKEKIAKLDRDLADLEARQNRSVGSLFRQNSGRKSAGQQVIEHADFKAWRDKDFITQGSMRIPVEGTLDELSRKATIVSSDLGAGTPGVMMPDVQPGLIALQKRELRIRSLLPIQQTDAATVSWLKQNTVTNAAYPQTEGAAKAESNITYTTASTDVKTLAHWMRITRQALADNSWLENDINNELLYGLAKVEENEILRGDGLGEHLTGIMTQATAYNAGYDVSGDTKLDKLRHSILQTRLSEFPVDGIVLNPEDVHDIELLKTEEGGANKGVYIVGNPRTGQEILTIWGKPVVETTAMPNGQFLTGSFRFGATLFDRMRAVIQVAFQDSDNFTKNLVTILAEERLALAVKRPAAFVTGAF